MTGRGTLDIPRFGALRRDNTPSPAECSWMIDSTMLLLELYEEEGSCPRLGLLLLSGVADWWLVLCLLIFLSYISHTPLSLVLRFLGGFIDQPTQGYNGNMSSRWVRIVGVWGTGLGPTCGIVVRRVPLGAAPRLGGLCAILSIIMAWKSRAAHSVLH